LEKLSGKEVNPNDIPSMTAVVREFLRKKFIEAEVRISRANTIAADLERWTPLLHLTILKT